MKATAYLIGIFANRPLLPLLRVGIFNSPPGALVLALGKEIAATFLEVEGESFDEARETILRNVRENSAFAFAQPWLTGDPMNAMVLTQTLRENAFGSD